MINCPVCGKPYSERCRCTVADSTCENGHHWHWCPVHDKLVIGEFNHWLPGCTCKKSLGHLEPTQKGGVFVLIACIALAGILLSGGRR